MWISRIRQRLRSLARNEKITSGKYGIYLEYYRWDHKCAINFVHFIRTDNRINESGGIFCPNWNSTTVHGWIWGKRAIRKSWAYLRYYHRGELWAYYWTSKFSLYGYAMIPRHWILFCCYQWNRWSARKYSVLKHTTVHSMDWKEWYA